jgi:hypothetical protein
MALVSVENQHMLSEIVLGLLDSAERLCLSAVRLVFATDGLCVRAVRGLVFTPVRSVLERLLPLPPVSAPQPFAVAEGAMAPPEAAPPSSVPLAGFLVASSMSPVRTDRPAARAATPDSSDDEDGDVVADLTSCSFRAGQKETRDSSFRKRDAAKLDRAKAIKAHSSVLTSHLVTPGPAHRSIDHSAVSTLHETNDGKVAPHSVSITPRKVDVAERGPLTEAAFEPGLRIPAHSSSKARAAPVSSGWSPVTSEKAPVSSEKLPVSGEASEAYVQAKQGEASAMTRRRTPKGASKLGTFDVLSSAK